METVEAKGFKIPIVGLGTWTLRGRDCARLTEQAIRVGYRHIDTAQMYDNEREVGEGVRASGKRNEVTVTTKVQPTSLAPHDLERSVKESLAKLRLDHIDLLLIHWPNPRVPLGDTLGAMNDLRARGLTRHIGVSNFTTALLAEAIRLSEAPLVADQVEYHPYLDQSKVHAACRAAGMAMVSYCPLHRGGELLSEKPVLDAARAHGRTPGQIVLRWHVQQEGVVAIPRTTRKERLKENLDVFGFSLTDAEMAAISGLARDGSRLCDFKFSPKWD
jgi:diketogulonate reductase-like aldo/keto reductase